MQIHISNVSKLVPRETLFALFSFLGDILMLEPIETGSSEWNCVFANYSDAQGALGLSRVELGDSIFYVEFAFNLLLPQPARTQGNPKCRTAVLYPRISFAADEDSLRSFFLAVEHVYQVPETGAVLIEFSDRPEMLKACGIKDDRYELWDASCCFKLPVVTKEPKLYGVPASKLLSVRTAYNSIPATPLPINRHSPKSPVHTDKHERRHSPDYKRRHSPDYKRSHSPDYYDRQRRRHSPDYYKRKSRHDR